MCIYVRARLNASGQRHACTLTHTPGVSHTHLKTYPPGYTGAALKHTHKYSRMHNHATVPATPYGIHCRMSTHGRINMREKKNLKVVRYVRFSSCVGVWGRYSEVMVRLIMKVI